MNKRRTSEKVTQAELDGDIFIAAKLTPAEKKEADRQLAEARRKNKKPMTEEVRVGLIQHRVRSLIDDYLENKKYDPAMNFGYFLKEYVDKLKIKQKDFAGQIGIDESLLSQLINGHRLPPDYITIRLEFHSGNRIPAGHWYKLITMEKEHYIKTDKEIRKKQRKFVHNPLYDQKASIARNGQEKMADGKNAHVAAAGAKNGRATASRKNGRTVASSRSRLKTL